MDRRSFIGSCSAQAASACAGLTAASALPVFAADARPRTYGRTLLTNEQGDALRLSSLKPRTNYVFHYPFEATPVFLLDLGQVAQPRTLQTKESVAYAWPGGVGRGRSVVAFSAICAHQLVYPTKDVSFISFRRLPAAKGVAQDLIHCCADHSQYDPARGAQVMAGPAQQPLCAVLLEHDVRSDTVTAFATLGGELFDAFFQKYAFKLSLEVGPSANRQVEGRSVVRELEKYCRNAIQC